MNGVVVMQWTNEPPKEPGWYWKRLVNNFGRQPEAIIVHLDAYDVFHTQQHASMYVIVNDSLQWAGPIPEPVEPEE